MNWMFIRQVGPLRWSRRMAVRQFYKRVLHRDLKLRLPTGLSITLPQDSRFGSEAYVTGANVDCGAEALLARLSDDARDFIDVGANIGYYSLYMAPRVRRVAAFEPDQRTLPTLRANAIAAGNVDVIAKGVTSETGTVGFDASRSSEFSHIDASSSARIPTVSIDDFVTKSGFDVGQLKIDVEGYDLARVLQ